KHAALSFYYRDIFHAIEPEDSHRVAIARAGDAVPMAPGQHQAVRFDHTLGLDIAANPVVTAAHGAMLFDRVSQGRELCPDLGWSCEAELFSANAQLGQIERELSNRRASRASERCVREGGNAFGGT